MITYIVLGVIILKFLKQQSSVPNDSTAIVENVNKYNSEIKSASEKTGMPVIFLKAIMYSESGGNPYAKSSTGAYGLMQISEIQTKQLGYDYPIYNVSKNILAGAQTLKMDLNQMGNMFDALRAYNVGVHEAKINPNSGKNYADRVTKNLKHFE